MGSDFSVTRLYRRLWSAILRNGPITTIIRLIKLALLTCFSGLYKRVMRAILVRWKIYGENLRDVKAFTIKVKSANVGKSRVSVKKGTTVRTEQT